MRELAMSGLPHTDAYNPALVRWQGRTLMIYRTREFARRRDLFIGELDEELRPRGEFIPVSSYIGDLKFEDPRFFVHQGRLHFSSTIYDGSRKYIGIATVDEDLAIRDFRAIKHAFNFPTEKNWIFFEHGDGDLYFTYAMSEGVHQVHRLVNGTGEPCHETAYRNTWEWGRARGGTQLIAHAGLWFGFFHGTAYHCDGIEKRYFMGVYAVAPEPPFPIVKMSRCPLYTPLETRHCGAGDRSRGGTAAVVFPSGLMFKDGHWVIAAGWNDCAIKVFTISHDELELNLEQTIAIDQHTQAAAENSGTGRKRAALVHFNVHDRCWMEALETVRNFMNPADTVFAPDPFLGCFDHAMPCSHLNEAGFLRGPVWIILHKDHAREPGMGFLRQLKSGFTAVFANEVFVVFAGNKPAVPQMAFNPVHLEALWKLLETNQ